MLHLIERLESLVAEGTRIPLSGRALIDEKEFLDIIDQLRVSLPEELRQARRVTQERERLLAESRSEAERVVHSAEQQAAFMLQDTELSKSAQRRAELLVEQAQEQAAAIMNEVERRAASVGDEAQRQAEEVRAGADAYARDVLHNLERELNRHILMVRNGLDMLDKPMSDVMSR